MLHKLQDELTSFYLSKYAQHTLLLQDKMYAVLKGKIIDKLYQPLFREVRTGNIRLFIKNQALKDIKYFEENV